MTEGNLERVREIFLAARGLSVDQRAAFLKSACGDDVGLREELQQLLGADAAAAATVEKPESFATHPPSQIGRYTILGPLGEGGMGVVYKAEQRHPIRRIVALKVIRLGFDSNEVIARFESERQALARMDHPNIARVLDAGTDDRGRPYFVMEYVPGTPITKYADENRLTIQQRLELMLQVCDAIAHAHAKAIIHRDIKAGNVLAYTTPDGPRVKVIDFGVAKALTLDRLTDRTFNTAHGQAIGTYESMSPEQADGSPDIDTRTDVYSLGVLLYELLSGSKPFDKSNLAKAADQEIRRIIREDEPPRPSTQLSSMGDNAPKIAKARQVDVDVLTRQLKSELDWIPLMALRKERERRYATPQQIAEDIYNYLNGIPLMAAPDSRTYRAAKLLRRNKGKLSVVSGVFVTLLLVIAAQLQANARVKASLQATIREREEKQAVNRFLTMILSEASSEQQGRSVTVVQAMELCTTYLEQGYLNDHPPVEAELRDTIGRIELSLNEYEKAEATLRRALEIKRANLPAGNIHLAPTLNVLGLLLLEQNRLLDAEPLFRETLQIYRHAWTTGDSSVKSDYLVCLGDFTILLLEQARTNEADLLYQEALAVDLTVDADGSFSRSGCVDRVARFTDFLSKCGHRSQGESLFGRYVELCHSSSKKEAAVIAYTVLALAHFQLDGNHAPAAELTCRNELTELSKLPAANMRVFACNSYVLGQAILAQGRVLDAIPFLNSAIDFFKQSYGRNSNVTIKAAHTLADALVNVNPSEAKAISSEYGLENTKAIELPSSTRPTSGIR